MSHQRPKFQHEKARNIPPWDYPGHYDYYYPYREPMRPLAEIMADIRKPVPPEFWSDRGQQESRIIYVDYHNMMEIMRRICGGAVEFLTEVPSYTPEMPLPRTIVNPDHPKGGGENARVKEKIVVERMSAIAIVRSVVRVHAKEGTFQQEGVASKQADDMDFGGMAENLQGDSIRRALMAWGLGQIQFWHRELGAGKWVPDRDDPRRAARR